MHQDDGDEIEKYHFVEKMKDRSVKSNSDLSLICLTNDPDNTRLIWRFNEMPLQSNSRYQINESALIIMGVVKKDMGIYECIATNLVSDRVLKAQAEIVVIGLSYFID